MAQFKDLLRQAMDERKLKAIDVSRISGIGSGAMSMYLSGARIPKIQTVKKIANAMNVSVLYFLGLDVLQDQEG